MSIKCSGTEFLRFYNDKDWWFSDTSPVKVGPDEATWYDDAVIEINGQSADNIDIAFDLAIKPDDLVYIDGGCVFGKVVGKKEPSFEAYFKRWMKAQTTTSFVAECPKDKLDEIVAAIKAAGGKVVS